MLRRIEFFAGILVVMLAASGCQTTGKTDQELQIDRSSFSKLATINIYDGVVKFPAPVWAGNALTMLESSKPFTDQKGNTYTFGLIHKDDSFDRWDRIYSISGSRNPRKARLGPDSYAYDVTNGYLSGCPRNARERLEPTWSENGSRTMVLLCGNTARSAGRYGYGLDVGEVALMRFLKFEDTLIAVQFSWRIPSFQIPSLPTRSWLGILDWLPIYDELIVMAERFKEISVVDPQQIEFEVVPLKGNSQASAP